MRTRRLPVPTWKTLAPIWVGALGASIFFGGWVGAQLLPEEGVSCAPNELLYTRIHDFPAQAFEDEVAGIEDADTPDVALDEFLKKAYPKINKSEFKKTKHEGSEAKFEKEKDGKSVAEVRVQRVGDSWEVAQFTACNSVAEEGSDQ